MSCEVAACLKREKGKHSTDTPVQMWGRMRPCDFFKGGSNGIRGKACGVGSPSDGVEGKRIDVEGILLA